MTDILEDIPPSTSTKTTIPQSQEKSNEWSLENASEVKNQKNQCLK